MKRLPFKLAILLLLGLCLSACASGRAAQPSSRPDSAVRYLSEREAIRVATHAMARDLEAWPEYRVGKPHLAPEGWYVTFKKTPPQPGHYFTAHVISPTRVEKLPAFAAQRIMQGEFQMALSCEMLLISHSLRFEHNHGRWPTSPAELMEYIESERLDPIPCVIDELSFPWTSAAEVVIEHRMHHGDHRFGGTIRTKRLSPDFPELPNRAED